MHIFIIPLFIFEKYDLVMGNLLFKQKYHRVTADYANKYLINNDK